MPLPIAGSPPSGTTSIAIANSHCEDPNAAAGSTTFPTAGRRRTRPIREQGIMSKDVAVTFDREVIVFLFVDLIYCAN
jgi:hypothetical protein